ncbi:MAG TPA: GAF domain-containing protein, partial [Stellaceae bacterium]|nr:GAF domain-containing protein [Stellaceae bacterium]
GVINSSPGDLAPVFDAILQKAQALCGAAAGALLIFEGGEYRVAAVHALPGTALLTDYWQPGTRLPLPPRNENSPIPRVMRGEPYVHVVDATAEPDYRNIERYRRVIDAGGGRTLLIVPLRKDDAVAGVIVAVHQVVRPFTDQQIALLQNFAAQAVIAMENARLMTETREALEQQTATAEVLQVINASPGNLAPVFDAMLEKAMRLCEAAFGGLWTFEGDRYVASALRNVPRAYADFLAADTSIPGPGTAPYRYLRGERGAIHNLDLGAEEPYRAGDPARLALVDLGGARAALQVPLRKDDSVLGVITIYRQEVRPFTDKQIALLENFAAQAVIAMENARLLGELHARTDDLQEALKYQTATNDVLKVLSNAAFDLKSVLELLIETAVELCDGRMAFIYRRYGEVYKLDVSSGFTPEYHAYMASVPVSPGPGSLVGRVTASGRAVHIADAANDPDYTWAEAQQGGQYRTMLGVPMLRDGELIGVISVTRDTVRPFGEAQIELMTAFADQAVIAIENARLLTALRQRTEEVAELNRGLEARVAAQVEELGRVGRLKQFLAPQLAELVVSQGEGVLESHRREIVVVFCDLRGYTGFSETAEPEEVIEVLREYHAALGPLVGQFEGTVDQFSGDGVMVFFNDPIPCPNPAERAVDMAMAMREAAGGLMAGWRRRGHQLGFGVGIAQGYATLGQIGFAERVHYTAIGTVCNLAARLCAEAQPGQILVSQRVATAVEDGVRLEEIGNLALKGLSQAVAVYNVVGAA